jgi:hypothetical protein
MLNDMIRSQSLSDGVIEVLGYIQIAHDDGHSIDSSLTDSINLPDNSGSQKTLRVTIPRVTIIASKSYSEISKKPR